MIMKTKLLLLLIALVPAVLPAGDGATPENSGLPVGERAPAFTLKDQHGDSVSLASLLQKGPVALVFFRSADWCQYCRLQLVQLQQNLRAFEATGGQIVGVSYDAPEILKKFAARNAITFPLLSDAGSHTIDAFDIRNKEAPQRWDGIARHATFIVDQAGMIRAKLYQVSYREKSAVAALVNALKIGGGVESPSSPTIAAVELCDCPKK
jgi:peroxiredoxin